MTHHGGLTLQNYSIDEFLGDSAMRGGAWMKELGHQRVRWRVHIALSLSLSSSGTAVEQLFSTMSFALLFLVWNQPTMD